MGVKLFKGVSARKGETQGYGADGADGAPQKAVEGFSSKRA